MSGPVKSSSDVWLVMSLPLEPIFELFIIIFGNLFLVPVKDPKDFYSSVIICGTVAASLSIILLWNPVNYQLMNLSTVNLSAAITFIYCAAVTKRAVNPRYQRSYHQLRVVSSFLS